MRLLKENRPIAEVRAYIDSTYGRYGEPTAAEPVGP